MPGRTIFDMTPDDIRVYEESSGIEIGIIRDIEFREVSLVNVPPVGVNISIQFTHQSKDLFNSLLDAVIDPVTGETERERQIREWEE
jgi:hypothetical protein